MKIKQTNSFLKNKIIETEVNLSSDGLNVQCLENPEYLFKP